MKKNAKSIVVIVLSALVIFGFSLYGLFRGPESYSMSERRTLAQFPKVSAERVESGKFMSEFETYSQDQFPLRDGFRRLKAVSSGFVFRQKDNHGLYSVDGYLSKLEYPMNSAKVERGVGKLRQIYEKQIADSNCKVYLSVIPDKNYFLAPKGGYPTMDYEKLVSDVRGTLDFAAYVDIFDTLSLTSYYTTDQHWQQEATEGTAKKLAEAMGADIEAEYTENILDVPFYGAYVGQSALPFPADTIRYWTNDTLEACTVTSYNTGKAAPAAMYDMKKAQGRDPYEMFLSGSDPLLVIDNPNAETDRELVVFRDSFASSIVPLLVPGYARITLVDLRYMRGELLGNFLTFTDQDVLFLYSTLVLNNNLSM